MKLNSILLSFSLATLSSTLASALCPELEPVELFDGIAVENIAADPGDFLYFAIESPGPGSDLVITASDLDGPFEPPMLPVELLVRKDKLPTRGIFDATAGNFSESQQIRITEPGPGTYYLLMSPFDSFSGGTLTASYTEPLEIPEVTKDVPITNISGSYGDNQLFKFVTDGLSPISITTSGGTGDMDILVNYGNLPDFGNSDAIGNGPDNNEEVILYNPQAGTYYIQMSSFDAFSGTTLTVSSAASLEVTEISGGDSVFGLSAVENASIYYIITAPDNGKDIQINTTGFGDLDLFVQAGSPPSPFSYELASENGSSVEQVTVRVPVPGEQYYILLYAYNQYSNVNLQVNYVDPQPTQSLTKDVPRFPLGTAANLSMYFQVEVPAGQCNLTVTTTGGNGDLDLYVKRGTYPAQFNFDEFSATQTNEEQVIIPQPEPGTYYIQLYAWTNFSGVTLTASTTPDPDANPWAGAETYPNGWSELLWFGLFTQFEQGWIYHIEHGFQFYFGADPSSFVFYDMNIGSWFWSSEEAYPALYKFGPNAGWYWYETGGQPGGRLFKRLADGTDVPEGDL